MTGHLVPTSALPAWEALNRALVGYQPPCQSNPDLWQSTNAEAVSAAADGCRQCHAVAECGAYAGRGQRGARRLGRDLPRLHLSPEGARRMRASTTPRPTPLPPCASCGASDAACDGRRWLSGRGCCDDCTHPTTKPETTE